MLPSRRGSTFARAARVRFPSGFLLDSTGAETHAMRLYHFLVATVLEPTDLYPVQRESLYPPYEIGGKPNVREAGGCFA